MGIKTIEQWTCDLCGRYSKITDPDSELKNWIKINIEDSMIDRAFHTKCICPTCLKDISLASKI